MERREFFKTVFATSLLAPLLLAAEKDKNDLDLYLIGDEPELFLPRLFDELKKFGICWGENFSFSDSHPREDGLKRALFQDGWRLAKNSQQADLSLSFFHLQQRAIPSFTLVKKGKIWDVRARKLYSLWKEMNESHHPSSCLTVATFKKRRPFISSGEFVSIYCVGRRIERFSLKENISRSFRLNRGKIEVRVKGGKAWVSNSSCRQKICLYSSPVSLAGERIICAPNHFLLEIQGGHSIDTAIG